MTGISLNDLYPAGAILKREYCRGGYKLWLWHFAYNSGDPILLGSWRRERALDLAAEWWGLRLMSGQLPSCIIDKKGKAWERMWITLCKQKGEESVEEPPQGPEEIKQ